MKKKSKKIEEYQRAYKEARLRKDKWETLSGRTLEPVYYSRDSELQEGELPGQFPFTRGVYPTMYRGRLWSMRQFAGFGSPEDTNKRFHYLLEQGITGLSTAFDMPTLMGYDPDHKLSRGEVGREGVSVATIEDMERLFEGISLGGVSTSMTINCTAPVALAMYFAVAKRQGVELGELRGTIQNDILKEFIAQKEWICPPKPSLGLCVDVMEYCAKFAKKFHPVSISGYHIREAGATAVEELALTLYDGLTYVEELVGRGLDIDEFAGRLSFFFDVHNDFFEEICKFRAARRLWAKLIKERFNPKVERSLLLRTHAQTAGVSLTAQQPVNNVARVAIQALAAVLGGTQSLHTNSMDETLSLPTEEAVTVALRTQQIIAHETGVCSVADPLGGSYFVEKQTDELEQAALEIIKMLDAEGGMVDAIDRGIPQMMLSESSYRYQKKVEADEELIVGVNAFSDAQEQTSIPIHRSDESVERMQIERLRAFKENRSSEKVRSCLAGLEKVMREGDNIMEVLIEAVDSGVTLGEVSELIRDVFGVYRDPGFV